MKKSCSILICIFACIASSSAQLPTGETARIYKSMDEVVKIHYRMRDCMVADSTAIDTVMLQVDYQYNYSRNRSPFSATIRLEKGRSGIKQTDMRSYYNGLINAVLAGRLKTVDTKSLYAASKPYGYRSDVFLETWYNFGNDRLTVICGDMMVENHPGMYQEPTPNMDWVLTEQTDSVCGYACKTAQTKFRGREWKVWYTPEIPLNFGPWKLSGLPGLILRAETDGFGFECVAIRQPENKLIYRNSYKGIRDFKTRENYIKYERRCFEHPVEMLNQSQKTIVYMVNSERKLAELGTDWSVPYDPLEKE